MITILIIGAAISPHKSHADSSLSMNGFVIEADRVEGVMGIPLIRNSETTTQKNKLMLRLTFQKATIYGLTITKELNTPNGPVTIQFKSTGPVELSNMAVDVTKVEFGGIYLPNQLGELGMKNVRLVAHKQTADDAILPALVASMEERAANVDTTSDSDENLEKQADLFKKILEDSKNGKLQHPLDDLNKTLQPKKEESGKELSDSKALDKINKALPPNKSEKKEDVTASEDKKKQSINNDPPTDSKASNNEDKANGSQNNQQSDKLQPTEEENSGANSPTSGDSKQNIGTVEEQAPPAGAVNSGSTHETKHGGPLDLLTGLFP